METTCLHVLLSGRGKVAQGELTSLKPALKLPLWLCCVGWYLSELEESIRVSTGMKLCPGDVYNRFWFRRGVQKKGPKMQQATPLSAPGERSWEQCLRRHLLNQRTPVTQASLHIETLSDMALCFQSHLELTCALWQPRSDWPQICVAARVRSALTPVLLVVRNWELESDTAALAPDCRPESLSLSKWFQCGSYPLHMVGGDPGTTCVVLLASLTLALGFWPQRFSKVAVNWMWRYSLWFLQFFFFKKRPLPSTALGQIKWQCFLI